jgi:hypothetical protein
MSQASLYPDEKAQPSSHLGRIWPPSSNPAVPNITEPAANMTGRARSPPAGTFDYDNQDKPHG